MQYFTNFNHCVKSVRIRSYSGLHFPAFGLNTERDGVSLRIHSKCGKMRTRITPNTDTFYAVNLLTLTRAVELNISLTYSLKSSKNQYFN